MRAELRSGACPTYRGAISPVTCAAPGRDQAVTSPRGDGMDELECVAEALARHLGVAARVRLLQRRAGFDLLHAATARGSLVIKVGPATPLTREACNLQRARTLVGDLVP